MNMTTPLCRQLGIRYPIHAFSHSVDVTIRVTLAGGFAVLGAARDNPEDIARMIDRVRTAVGTRRFGVDLMFPKLSSNTNSREEIKRQLPATHTDFVANLKNKYSVPPATKPHFFTDTIRSQEFFEQQLEAVLSSSVDLVALAVGTPPPIVGRIKESGKIALALVGSPKHAHAAISAGVDILVAQGNDAGGHTGPIGTFTLVPQIIELAGKIPVIAAGGIGHGRQIAAALAMGAHGAWLGTAWLATQEHALPQAVVRKLLAAESADTMITRSHSGKTCRITKGGWTDEWHSPGAPDPLPMPYQHVLTGGLIAAVEEHEIDALLYTPAGQGVVWTKSVESVSEVMRKLIDQARSAMEAFSEQHF